MTSPFTPLLSPPLSALLSTLPPSHPISTLSRLPPSRLSRTAIPHISAIELVSGPSFSTFYDDLYTLSFPKPTERERSALIVDRLHAQFSGGRPGHAPYRIVGLRDTEGGAIGAAQFSVLPLHTATLHGERVVVAVPYLQYIYVRASSRRLDMAEVLHTLVLAVAMADAVDMTRSSPTATPTAAAGVHRSDSNVPIVPFTLFETDPPDHGEDAASRAYASQRVQIHARGGAVALMLRCSTVAKEGGLWDGEQRGSVVSPHIQPGLEVGEGPVPLVWVVRPAGAFEVPKAWYGMGEKEEGEEKMVAEGSGETMDLEVIGSALITAYYKSLLDEGFPVANVVLAKEMYERRRKGRRFFVMPLEDVTEEMLHG